MSKVVYKYNFAIIKMETGGFIIYNMNKPFEKGHTHQNNFNTCIALVKLAHNKQMPRSNNKYFIKSLCRISEDREYIKQLKEMNTDYKWLMEDTHGINYDKC